MELIQPKSSSRKVDDNPTYPEGAGCFKNKRLCLCTYFTTFTFFLYYNTTTPCRLGTKAIPELFGDRKHW